MFGFKMRFIEAQKKEKELKIQIQKTKNKYVSDFALPGQFIEYIGIRMLVVCQYDFDKTGDLYLKTEWFNTLGEIQRGAFGYDDLQFLKKL
jgi:hypothetical protein